MGLFQTDTSTVDVLADDAFDVEFADTKGRTLTTCAVETRDLLKLTHELAAQQQ